MKKTVILLIFLFPALCFAQQEVSGKINNEKGAPLANASIMITGTSVGTVSGEDGSFRLSVPASAKSLTISFTNYASQVISLNGRSNFDIKLLPEEAQLSEVVVTGYTSVKRKEATSAISKISAPAINNTSSVDVNELLKGRVAGVLATAASGQPGSVQQVRIRGTNSLSSGNAPLYVIDGIVVARGEFNDNTGNQTNDILSNLNPSDVESMDILKDASATSLYGARGANGVIVITTKKGKVGKAEISVNTQYGFTQPSLGKFKLMNAKEWVDYERLVLTNYGATEEQMDDPDYYNRPVSLANTNFNWLDAALVKGNSSKVDVSVSGGNENTRVYIGGGYNKVDGVVIGSGLKKYSLLTNITQKVGDRLTLNGILNLSYGNTQIAGGGNSYSSPLLNSIATAPVLSPYKPDGSLYVGPEAEFYAFSFSGDNFLYNTKYNFNRNNNLRLLTKIGADYKITNWLKFSQNAAVDWIDARETTFWDARTPDGVTSNGYVYEAANQNKIYTLQSSLSGNYSVNKLHNFDYLALLEYNYTENTALNAGGKGILANTKFNNIGPATTPSGLPGGGLTKLALTSLIGQVGYNYSSKYFVTLNLRRDGTSQFVKNKTDLFYSAGLAWRAINESFMANQNVISDLKIRGSYGTQGNISGLGNFEGYYLWNTTGYADAPGIFPGQLGNAELKWEKTKSADIGLEISFLKNRINLTADVYKKNTDRQLFQVPVSSTSGFTTRTDNVGSVENKGLELGLNTVNVRTKDFEWTIDANIAFNKNKVTALYNGQDIIGGQTITKVGESISSWYVREWAGVDPANGDPLWYDKDGKTTNNVSLARRVIYGQPIPKVTFGLTNTISYKGISLSALFYGVSGVTILNQTRYLLDGDGLYSYSGFNALKESATDYWTKPGDIVSRPKPILGGNKNSSTLSSRYYEKGDYLRVKNIVLSYALPEVVVQKLHLSRARVFIQADNVYTWTKYKGVDPEVGVDANEFFKYPVPKSVTFGVNLSFK